MATPAWVGTTSSAWATGTNWSTSSAPANGDTATFDWNATRSVAGSDQSAVTLAALNILSTFTGYQFGDLATALKIKSSTVRIGDASGSSTAGAHSNRINLDLSTTATVVTVVNTATTSADAGLEPVRIKAVNSSNQLIVLGGRVGVATNAIGDVATFGEIDCIGSSAVVNISSGVTLTTLRQEGGTVNQSCGCTTIYQDGGTLNTNGSGAITTIYVGGQANLNSSGTVTTLEVQADGTADMLNDLRAKTITTVKLYKGATFKFNPAVHTITNPILLIGCELEDVTIQTPNGISIAVVKT